VTDPVEDAKGAVVGELIKATRDNPDVKEAGRKLGQAANTVATTINNALLPLAAVNFAFDKARTYFAGTFQQDLSQKAEAIPPEHIVEPKASIAGPALQGLAFTHEEPQLRNLYLSLLATAMDKRKATDAHPAFVEIIKQMTAEEARLIQNVLRSSNAIALVEVRKETAGEDGWRSLARHLGHLCDDKDTPVEDPAAPAMIDNWTRLGLVEVSYERFLTGADSYKWVEERPEYKRLRQEHETDKVKLSYQRGLMARTALGIQFARAVGLI
jgi:hypothetical protein